MKKLRQFIPCFTIASLFLCLPTKKITLTRIELQLCIDPGSAEIVVNPLRVTGGYEVFTALIDTGAKTSLLPESIRTRLQHRVTGTIKVEQANIAQQSFQAVEAVIQVTLEDTVAGQTQLL
ncbi:MAG: hypothetical protein SGI73_03690 [Chloroflexota bacterium]|nr:hypothetical protein [Chloroflexota bacterium]